MSWPQIKQTLDNINILITDKYSKDYSIIVLFSSLGSSLLISSLDLISIYLSIELQSFGLYILASLYRNSESATNAGLKYFLLGGLSSCIILLGTGLIYSYTGTTNLESLYILNSISDINQQYILQGLSIGLILIFIGFLFKIAAAPLHNWSPDVYDGVPTIVTIWLTIVPKIAILILLLELQVQLGIIGGLKTIIINNTGYISTIENIGSIKDILLLLENFKININLNINNSLLGFPVLKTLIIISSILSLIIGSLLGLAQIKIKRLLAYSTISHIGFILLALAINTEQSIESFIFYILQYTVTNLNIFLIILGLTYIINNSIISPLTSLASNPPLSEDCSSVGTREKKNNIKIENLNDNSIITSYNNNEALVRVFTLENKRVNIEEKIIKDINYISEFKGLFFSNPFLSLSLATSLFSMAGIPPLIGFFSKQFVLYSALQNGYYFISILGIIVSVISASYYLKIIKILFTESTESELNSVSPQEVNLNKSDNIIITNTHSYLISILTLFILLFFIKPTIILNSTQLLSLSLFFV
uniref:NADH-ubiquinone oxidoreductase chain 2 n=1 Tax=Cyclocybe aegerita TaxID=1973307 RepID=A0A343S8G7_CYCAE|nr:NADH dehydrogenase subunit 2 [Cyclocybe aegerita]